MGYRVLWTALLVCTQTSEQYFQLSPMGTILIHKRNVNMTQKQLYYSTCYSRRHVALCSTNLYGNLAKTSTYCYNDKLFLY